MTPELRQQLQHFLTTVSQLPYKAREATELAAQLKESKQ